MMTRELLAKWNDKLYPKDYYGSDLTDHVGAEWFWDKLQIKSAPKFQDECFSHIPVAWKEDVALLIHAIKDKYPDTVFLQVKEKFCSLVVYFSQSNDKRDSIDAMIERCQHTLRLKGLHP